jgi:hypothetical protein
MLEFSIVMLRRFDTAAASSATPSTGRKNALHAAGLGPLYHSLNPPATDINVDPPSDFFWVQPVAHKLEHIVRTLLVSTSVGQFRVFEFRIMHWHCSEIAQRAFCRPFARARL